MDEPQGGSLGIGVEVVADVRPLGQAEPPHEFMARNGIEGGDPSWRKQSSPD
ncbi:hypothetical protein FHR81_001327 [Actinoalloteichus hoggarensis]|uniref:hypothetical protein n=1 Tax=Actinoalloteichus hoggarensis TaxID=1470176 RepID=UPI0017982CB5|nr:hypothetical protein [Actinoalloteichus hoggarensis]MBB5920297.1 hypothetical protein [Actinoalloteichus hoggarensis]